MPCRQALASIRRGGELVHIYDERLALRVIAPFGSCQQFVEEKAMAAEAPELLRRAQDAARAVHGALLHSCPGLVGAAATSLSTALRAREVRARLAGSAVRGNPLLKVVAWVAAATDAGRHLTGPMIEDMLKALDVALRPPNEQQKALLEEPLADRQREFRRASGEKNADFDRLNQGLLDGDRAAAAARCALFSSSGEVEDLEDGTDGSVVSGDIAYLEGAEPAVVRHRHHFFAQGGVEEQHLERIESPAEAVSITNLTGLLEWAGS